MTHRHRPLSWRDGLFHGLVIAGLLLSLIAFIQRGFGFDAVAYWSVDLESLYGGDHGALGFFPYSPAAALAALPFTWLPWEVFLPVWMAVLAAALLYLGRRSVLVLLAFPPVAIELTTSNIHLLLAAAVVIGLRYPAAWAFVLLTKVTPGIGLLWFAARGEWRRLAIALGTTAGIVVVTFVLLPQQWVAWIGFLADSSQQQLEWPAIAVPLWLRLIAAAALVLWGAKRDAYWTLPAAAMLAVPVLWVGSLSMLVGCWALSGDRRGYYVPDARAPGQRLSAHPDHHPAGVQRGGADRLGT